MTLAANTTYNDKQKGNSDTNRLRLKGRGVTISVTPKSATVVVNCPSVNSISIYLVTYKAAQFDRNQQQEAQLLL